MAGNSNDNAQAQQQNLDLRSALNDAYSAVQGAASVQSCSNYTFEDALTAQIADIQAPGTDTRPNELTMVQNILNKVTQAAQKIMSLPADQFVDAQGDRDVNTPP